MNISDNNKSKMENCIMNVIIICIVDSAYITHTTIISILFSVVIPPIFPHFRFHIELHRSFILRRFYLFYSFSQVVMMTSCRASRSIALILIGCLVFDCGMVTMAFCLFPQANQHCNR